MDRRRLLRDGRGRDRHRDQDGTSPATQRRTFLMATLARWCFRRRSLVLAAWLIALVLVAGIAKSVGSNYSNNFSFPSTDSSRALDIVKANFPAQSGDSDQIVMQAKKGTLST